MTRFIFLTLFMLLGGCRLVSAASQRIKPERAAINDYFNMNYRGEPVSFDIEIRGGSALESLGFADGRPAQAEMLEGSRAAVTKARIWTLFNSTESGHEIVIFAVTDSAQEHATPLRIGPQRVVQAGSRQISMAAIHTGTFAALVPVTDDTPFNSGTSLMQSHHTRHEFNPPVCSFELPGPVTAVSGDGEEWIGDGYIDSMLRVEALDVKIDSGPVFIEVRLAYEFEDNRTYRVSLRFTAGKEYVAITEDFNLGGNSRFVFNLDDWQSEWFFFPEDQRLIQWREIEGVRNPASDFITVEEQTCLARMVIWSQFNYFRGKQETLALMNPDRTLAVGAFYRRPDLWTRAKVNHVDLYIRPEVPGNRDTRGVPGLTDSEKRIAMEAWLVDGHRQWAIFARKPGEWGTRERDVRDDEGNFVLDDEGKRTKETVPHFETDRFFAKAHLQEGVWNLDRINRLPLVWDPSGGEVAPEDTAPAGSLGFGGDVNNALKGTGGRAGLQVFNGSNPNMRRGIPGGAAGYARWARETEDTSLAALRESNQINNRLVGPAMLAYMAMDDSAYPGERAMLPWTHPEALNPLYQGMENQNFNADRYRCVSALGVGLKLLKHPDGERILNYGAEQMNMALDAYVYPESGSWEESHTYAAHTMHNLLPLAHDLRNSGARDFFDDVRFARMFEFWVYAHSPRDARFGGIRIPPPVGDHGVSPNSFINHFQASLPYFSQSANPAVREIAGRMAWLLQEKDAEIPDGIAVSEPDNRSRFLQGYGASMRSFGPDSSEGYLLLRAGQAWGHHHMDKGAIWFWGRNVPFIVNAAWGSPPGGTYGNDYKQGPAGRTQIEFKGVNNWTLPAKYPAPWISDDEYSELIDYANARCMFPYNPALDLSTSTPPAARNGYDRQVLFIKPDVFVVRDNLETVCETVWRFHTAQPDNMQREKAAADFSSTEGVHGRLQLLWPPDVEFVHIAEDDLNRQSLGSRFGNRKGDDIGRGRTAGFDTVTELFRWDMPRNQSATWIFGVRKDGEPPLNAETIDQHGKVTRLTLPDGSSVIIFLNITPFEYTGNGIKFNGTVGVVSTTPDGAITKHLVRGTHLEINEN